MITTHDKAIIINDLANTYAIDMRYTKAIVRYKEALALYLSLAKTQPLDYSIHIAHVFSNLAIIHHNLSKPKEASEFHHNSLKMHRVLVKQNFEKFGVGLASCIMEGVHYFKEHTLMLYEAEDILKKFEDNSRANKLLKALYVLRRG